MIGLDLEHSVAVFGRVATLAGAYHVDVAGLLERLSALAPELAAEALITVPSTFDRIAVATRILRGNDGIDRVRSLSRACDPRQPARLEALAGAETSDLWIELETVPGESQACALTVSAYGKRVLSADLGRLTQFGVAPDVLAQLETLTTTLVGEDKLIGLADRADTAGARSWTIHVAHRNATDEQRAAAVNQITTVAATVGVGEPQRNLVSGLHATFARARDSYSWLRVRENIPGIELGVMWADVPWEHLVNMMLGFAPNSESSARLGELSGAFDAAAASAVELELGSSKIPRMRASVTLRKGRPQS
ncbi:MAG: hypothetical protein JWP01_1748 [Myxococcales bacterium]|nr:hypothetical protein [Myxococcales bacterium]